MLRIINLTLIFLHCLWFSFPWIRYISISSSERSNILVRLQKLQTQWPEISFLSKLKSNAIFSIEPWRISLFFEKSSRLLWFLFLFLYCVLRDQSYITSAKRLGGSVGLENGPFCWRSVLYLCWWVRKSSKLCWHNIWMVPWAIFWSSLVIIGHLHFRSEVARLKVS